MDQIDKSPVAIRRKWDVNHLCELMLLADYVLSDYAAQCLEAEAAAPAPWRKFWRDEAQCVNATRRSLMHRIQTFVDYASGNPVETLGQRRMYRG